MLTRAYPVRTGGGNSLAAPGPAPHRVIVAGLTFALLPVCPQRPGVRRKAAGRRPPPSRGRPICVASAKQVPAPPCRPTSSSPRARSSTSPDRSRVSSLLRAARTRSAEQCSWDARALGDAGGERGRPVRGLGLVVFGRRRPGRSEVGARADIYRSSVYLGAMTKRSMQEATFLILTALASGSQHGY